MSRGRQVWEKYHNLGLMRRNLLLLPWSVAIDCLQECNREGLTLLGFDAFRLYENDQIQPLMEFSIDVSNSARAGLSRDQRFAEAESMLVACPQKDLWFEFVVEEFP